MGKSSRKILAIILAVGILATLVAVPVTVSAVPADETYEAYDVVTYHDLLSGGNPLTAAKTSISGNPKFAYNCTSPTYSVILKYRWTAGDDPHFVFFFDAWGGSAYPYSLAVKRPGFSGLGAAAGENGAWHLDPSVASHIVQMDTPIVEGQDYDIEHARLKVATGENAGKYYVYVKVNGELIYGYYYDGDNGDGTYGSSNQAYDPSYLRFTSASAGNYISAIPVPDVYDDYDEVTYYDFVKDDALLYDTYPNEYSINDNKFTYNKTSEYGSAVIKYRWKGANTGSSFYISFDPPPKTSDPSQPATEYTFGILYSGSAGTIWLRIGNGSAKALSEPLTMGNDYDIEYGRLKVIGGDNAGKYKLYIRITDVETGDEMYYEEKYIEASVVDANGQYTSNTDGAGSGVTCTISNSFRINFWGNGGGNKIAPIPVPETYEDYDEVTYYDMKISGNALPDSGLDLGTNRTITYDVTSPTHSAVLKFRWTAGETARFALYFDAWSGGAYPFCLFVKNPGYSSQGAAAGANGAWHIDPSNAANIVQMSTPITAGSTFDMEYGRLKVKTGPNSGKYYVYLKVDGVLTAYYYYDGVSADGTSYKNGAGSFTNEIRLNSSETGNIFAPIPEPETYDTYDEVNYEDFLKNGASLGSEYQINSQKFTYNKTSASGSAIIRYRWKDANTGSSFYISFDPPPKTSNPNESAAEYTFGILYSGSAGTVWLRIGNGNSQPISEPLTMGNDYDIEFARLKVANGPNKGKYKLYFKVTDGVTGDVAYYEEKYIEKTVVNENGQYVSNTDGAGSGVTCTISNSFYISFWGNGGGNKITAIPAVGDLDGNGVVNATDLTMLRNILLEIEVNPGNIADFNKDTYVDIRDLVAMKKYIIA